MLWSEQYDEPTEGYHAFSEAVLRVAKNVVQSHLPVVLSGAGIGVPPNITSCVESRYFSSFDFLVLTCERETLRKRLLARTSWRGTSSGEKLTEQLEFNGWFRDKAPNLGVSMEFADATHAQEEETVVAVRSWIEAKVSRLFDPQ